jgi:1-acyl-sn-glycerol-3-phosphate acyltransferase
MVLDYSFGVLYEFWPWFINTLILFVDRYFGGWLDWLLPFNFRKYIWVTALILFVILPALFVIYLYITVISLFIFRRRKSISRTVKRVVEDVQGASLWEGFIEVTCQWWSFHAQVWHSYQVHGEEKIVELQSQTPKKGCLIVYYHGALPVDIYYFVTWFRTKYRIMVRSVIDHFLFKVPGLSPVYEIFGATSGPRDKIVNLLKNGNVVIVSPGGVREALFSKNYEIIWGERTGFAQCAIDADVPIIPMFTSNIRQAFDFPERMKGNSLKKLYEWTRLPFSVVFGGFPVKLDSHFGCEISSRNKTASELRDEVRSSLRSLIFRFQYSPSDWWAALLYSLRIRIFK